MMHICRQAAIRRNDALKSLREIKAAQFRPIEDPKRPSEYDVRAAVTDYEMALNKELSLRTIIPGVRIVAPNDPKSKDEDVAAAKQFLGRDLKDELAEDQSNVVRQPDEERKRLLLQSRRRFDGKTGSSSVDKNDADEGISNSAKAVLLLVAVSQILLLIILSVDPMTAGDTLTSIFGNSPLDIY